MSSNPPMFLQLKALKIDQMYFGGKKFPTNCWYRALIAYQLGSLQKGHYLLQMCTMKICSQFNSPHHNGVICLEVSQNIFKTYKQHV